jgi:murein DD-endopeptidase / murein LD-carboxypeptidase
MIRLYARTFRQRKGEVTLLRKVLVSGSLAVSLLVPAFHQAEAEELQNYDRLLPVAKKFEGVPYQWGGTSAKGFDCSGFIVTVFKELDINLPRTTKGMYGVGESVSKDKLRVGDLVFFHTYGSGVSHAGIYIGNGEFIHSSSSKGVIVSKLDDPYYWKHRYLGARRVLDYELDAGYFQDLSENHFAFEAANTLAKDHLLLGYEDSYFLPNEPITRGEVAAFISQALDLQLNNRNDAFMDVPSSHWAVGVVNAVKNEGIFYGSQNQFRPDEPLTRAQLAAILVRAFDLTKGNQKVSFTDVPSNHWAYNDIQILASLGITKGYGDGTFRPNDKVTRAQFIAFLYRVLY